MSIIETAREYANRTKDQKFATIDDLVTSAKHDQEQSAERSYNLKDLKVVTVDRVGHAVSIPQGFARSNEIVATDSIRLASPKGTAKFTHWSFGQLCRTLGAPAGYLRDLPANLTADCLNHGLASSEVGTAANLLVKANGGEPVVRACTSDSYGRVWDADIFGAIGRGLSSDDSWQLESGYRGDRDSFVTLTTKKSVISDPSVTDRDLNDIMYRGILIRNSEVGASSVVIETVLYRARCKNLMLWSAVTESRFRRRHIGSKVTREVIREIGKIAHAWANASTERDDQIIRLLIDKEIASTKEAVIDELRAMKFTKEQAEEAYARCEQTETVSPRSFWGIAQGVTRLSQDAEYQDERYMLDRLASEVMARGAKLARVGA